jgi:hypothetical protein
LNSDHVLFIIYFLSEDNVPPRTQHIITNFHKADWPGYVQESRSLFSQLPLPTSCAKDELVFREVLLTASRHNIPAGFRKNFVPGLPPDAKPLIEHRDALRNNNPNDPEISRLNTIIADSIQENSRQIWQEKLKDSNFKDNPTKFWSLLKSLSGKSLRLPPNQPISFTNKAHTKAPSIAKNFCKQYTSVFPHTPWVDF